MSAGVPAPGRSGGTTEPPVVGPAGGRPGAVTTEAPPMCTPYEVQCDPKGARQACSESGFWETAGESCTRRLAVDDEIGSVRATKADGSYRCSGLGKDDWEALPERSYARVQLAARGYMGLTTQGEVVVSKGLEVPDPPTESHFDVEFSQLAEFDSGLGAGW